jgi:uncharacterized protein (DUF433 family)
MTQETNRYAERISQDPAVMVGKPVIRGTRIPVELVLGKFAYDLDLEELFAAYPELTIEDVKAALLFARAAVMDDYRQSGYREAAFARAKA